MLIASMDTSKQGSVSEADFVDHFTRLLAESPEILAGLPKIRAAAGRVWREEARKRQGEGAVGLLEMLPETPKHTKGPAPHDDAVTAAVGLLQSDDFCPACGNVYKKDAIFCRKCGLKRAKRGARGASASPPGAIQAATLEPSSTEAENSRAQAELAAAQAETAPTVA